ncbi:MAG: META domain-containing protein [Hyphomonadaceae bacterium]
MKFLFAALAAIIAACAATPSAALEGAWRLESMNGAAPIGPAPSMAFTEGRVSGNAGCNRYSGAYRQSGDRLVLGPLAATEMACIGDEGSPQALMMQETAFLSALAGELTVELQGEALELRGADGRVLRFRRTIP